MVSSSCIAPSALAAWCSGRLAEHERAEIDRHVDGCPSCRELMAAAGQVCASSHASSVDLQPGDHLGVDLLALGQLLQTRVGRYRMIEVVGGGGLGLVFSAWDEQLQRKVAIKVVRRVGSPVEGDPAIRQEARALAALSHPNVVEVFDVIEHQGRIFLVMALVSGSTLRAWQHGRPRDEIVRAYVAAARGVAAVHAAGLVHCDVKPDNVLVADDGRVLLADFGFAVLADPSVRHGSIGGTPRYMAPEQRRGGTLTPACDQYALCVSLWEALSGSVPPLDAAAIPRTMRRALRRGLRDEPRERWPSVPALVSALQQPRRRPALVAATAGLVGTAALVGLLAWPNPPQPAPSETPPEASGSSVMALLSAQAVDDAIAAATEARRTGDLLGAVRILGEVDHAPLDPESLARLQLEHARALDRVGRIADAKALLTTVEASTARASEALRMQVALEAARLGLDDRASSNRLNWLEVARASVRRAGRDPDRDLLVRQTSGYVARLQGRHEDALAHYEAAVALLDDEVPPLARVEVLAGHGRTLSRLGHHDEAERALARALALVDAHALERSDVAIATRIALGNAVARAGRRSEAITIFEQAIASADATPGFDPLTLGIALADLGASYLEHNDLPKARGVLDRAEAILPDSYAVQANLATYWSKIPCQGVFGAQAIEECKANARHEAHEYDVRAYDRGRQELGPDHPSVAQLGGNLMYDYIRRGELEQAEKYVEPCLSGLRSHYGDEHDKLLRPLLSATELYVRRGDRAATRRVVTQLEKVAAANAPALGQVANDVVGYALARSRIWAGISRADDPQRVRDALAALGPTPPADIMIIDSWFDGTDPLE